MIKINIYGSCVSRDIFEWDKEKQFSIPAYVARTSILSNLNTNIWNINSTDIDLDSKFQREAVMTDLNKTVYDKFKSNMSDYLLIDFIDERFRIAKVDDLYATYSVEMMNSHFLDGKDYILLDKEPSIVGDTYVFEDIDLDQYVKEFAKKISNIYDENRIIIHKAFMRDEYISKDGKLLKFKPHVCLDVKKNNAMLEFMYKKLNEYLPNAYVIDASGKYYVNEMHRWGLTPMHYEDEYYENLLCQIKDIVLLKKRKNNNTKSNNIKCDLSSFDSSYVDIEINENKVHVINNYVSTEEQFSYAWYINSIDENGGLANLYKSNWSRERDFYYELPKDRKYIYIVSYVKTVDNKFKVQKIIGYLQEDNGVYSICDKPVDQVTLKSFMIVCKNDAIIIKKQSDEKKWFSYAWYISENSIKNIIYKSEGFSTKDTFRFIPENDKSKYYFQIYVKDVLGNRKKIVTNGVKIADKYKKGKFGINISQFNCDMDLPNDETSVKWGKEILNGNLYVNKRFSNPMNIKEGIDWNAVYTDSPGTFQLYLQTLGMLPLLCRAYSIEKDTRYIAKANQILLDWIRYEKTDKSIKNALVWHDHGTALRANNIIYYALIVEEAGLADNNFVNFINSLIKKHIAYLSNHEKYTANHNHGIYQDQALMYCAYFIDDIDSNDVMEIAKQRLKTQIDYAFNKEKVHVENSSAYHIALLYMLNTIAEFLMKVDDPFAYYVKYNISKSAEFCSWLNRPNGNLINTGDSSVGNKIINIDIKADLLDNMRYLYSASQGEYGEKPRKASVIYPYSGYYFYKQVPNSDESLNSMTWKMFKAGYTSKTHKHADDISMTLYARGYDIFVDTGYYNYTPGNVFNTYFKSSIAHNTVVVDNKTYSTEEENSFKTGIYKYELGEKYDYVLGYNNMYRGVEIDRHFYSIYDATLIYDDICSNEYHVYTQIFHLSENMHVIKKDNREVILQIADTENTVRIQQLGHCNYTLSEIKGDIYSEDICGGYISYGQNETTTTTTLRFATEGKCVEFVTLITIEDDSGKIISFIPFEGNKKKIHYTKFVYNPIDYSFSFGDDKIYLYKRNRPTIDNLIVEVKEDKLLIEDNNVLNKCEYEYEIINPTTSLILYKQRYSKTNKMIYDLSQQDIVVKCKIKENDVEQLKSNIAYIKYNANNGSYDVDDKDYPFLNILYNGHYIEKKRGNEYRFIVDFDYSLDYSIRWYIYKNGGYYYTIVINDSNEFLYDFTSSGMYAVSCYLISKTGEKYFYEFKAININNDEDGE